MGNRLDRVIGNIFGAEKNYKKCIESSLKCDRNVATGLMGSSLDRVDG